MEQIPDRRAFLTIAASAAAGLAFTRPAAAKIPENSLTVTQLADNIDLIAGAGCNVVIVRAADGVVMVDGGLPEHSDSLIKLALSRSPGKRVQALVNSNWRLNHTGSNETLGKRGTRIIAHENTKLWMGADFFIEWQNLTHKPRPDYALPNDTFYTSGKMIFGATPIEYAHLEQASTDGDLYVLFPNENILVVSDLLAVGTYPLVDWSTGGWIGGMAKATKALLDLADEKTRVIPSVGPVQTKADLQAQYDMCSTVNERIGEMFKQGKSVDEVVAAAPTKEFDARWGDPELFLRLAYKGAWGHVREYKGVI
jgi:cyclase